MIIGTKTLPDAAGLRAIPSSAAAAVFVIIVFGIWRGGDRYEAHVEMLSEKIDLPRATREAALTRLVQEYADRLAAHVRDAPYNWLNFFDFWAR